MDTETNQVNEDWDWYDNPDPKEEAKRLAFTAAYTPKLYALANKVKAGEMTEEECVAAALQLQKELGDNIDSPAREAAEIRRVIRRVLDPDERERLWREQGIAAD
jgi:hypothetical protein